MSIPSGSSSNPQFSAEDFNHYSRDVDKYLSPSLTTGVTEKSVFGRLNKILSNLRDQLIAQKNRIQAHDKGSVWVTNKVLEEKCIQNLTGLTNSINKDNISEMKDHIFNMKKISQSLKNARGVNKHKLNKAEYNLKFKELEIKIRDIKEKIELQGRELETDDLLSMIGSLDELKTTYKSLKSDAKTKFHLADSETPGLNELGGEIEDALNALTSLEELKLENLIIKDRKKEGVTQSPTNKLESENSFVSSQQGAEQKNINEKMTNVFQQSIPEDWENEEADPEERRLAPENIKNKIEGHYSSIEQQKINTFKREVEELIEEANEEIGSKDYTRATSIARTADKLMETYESLKDSGLIAQNELEAVGRQLNDILARAIKIRDKTSFDLLKGKVKKFVEEAKEEIGPKDYAKAKSIARTADNLMKTYESLKDSGLIAQNEWEAVGSQFNEIRERAIKIRDQNPHKKSRNEIREKVSDISQVNVNPEVKEPEVPAKANKDNAIVKQQNIFESFKKQFTETKVNSLVGTKVSSIVGKIDKWMEEKGIVGDFEKLLGGKKVFEGFRNRIQGFMKELKLNKGNTTDLIARNELKKLGNEIREQIASSDSGQSDPELTDILEEIESIAEEPGVENADFVDISEHTETQREKQQKLFEDLKDRAERLTEELNKKGADMSSVRTRAARLMPHYERLKDSGVIDKEELEALGNQLNEIGEKVGDISQVNVNPKVKESEVSPKAIWQQRQFQSLKRQIKSFIEESNERMGDTAYIRAKSIAFRAGKLVKDYESLKSSPEIDQEELEAAGNQLKEIINRATEIRDQNPQVSKDKARLSEIQEKAMSPDSVIAQEVDQNLINKGENRISLEQKEKRFAYNLRTLLNKVKQSTDFAEDYGINSYIDEIYALIESPKPYDPKATFEFLEEMLIEKDLATRTENGEFSIKDEKLFSFYNQALKSYQALSDPNSDADLSKHTETLTEKDDLVDISEHVYEQVKKEALRDKDGVRSRQVNLADQDLKKSIQDEVLTKKTIHTDLSDVHQKPIEADFVDISEHRETLKEKEMSSAKNLNTLLKTMQKATRFGRQHPEAFESFAHSVNDFIHTGKAFGYQEVMDFIKEVLEAEHLVEKNEKGELSIVNSDELSVGDYPRLSKDYEKFINSYKAFDDEQEKHYTLAFGLKEVLRTMQKSTQFGNKPPETFNRFLGSVNQFLESEKEYHPEEIFGFIDAILVAEGLAVENENGEISIVAKENLPPGDYEELLNNYEGAIKSYKRFSE